MHTCMHARTHTHTHIWPWINWRRRKNACEKFVLFLHLKSPVSLKEFKEKQSPAGADLVWVTLSQTEFLLVGHLFSKVPLYAQQLVLHWGIYSSVAFLSQVAAKFAGIPRCVVQRFIELCDTCRTKKKQCKNPNAPTGRPTLTRRPFQRCQVIITITITIYFINLSGKLKLSFDCTTKNISQ